MISRRLFVAAGLMASCAGTSFLTSCALEDSKSPTLPGDIDANEYGEIQKATYFLYDTVINISAYTTPEVMVELESNMKRYENLFSRTIAGSDVDRINTSQGKPVEVDPLTSKMIEQALKYCYQTDGLFNIAIGRITELWNFPNKIMPSQQDLDAALKHIDYTKVVVDGNKVSVLDPEIKLELGAVAKGYIADLSRDFLLSKGCKSAILNLGGNTYALGTKPQGKKWVIGIQDPTQPTGQITGTIEAMDESIVTSGLYERSFEKDGKLYHHILDPKTGMPIDSGILGVTIVGKSSFICDILSTTTFLLGIEKGMEFLKGQSGYKASFINMENQPISTPDFIIKTT